DREAPFRNDGAEAQPDAADRALPASGVSIVAALRHGEDGPSTGPDRRSRAGAGPGRETARGSGRHPVGRPSEGRPIAAALIAPRHGRGGAKAAERSPSVPFIASTRRNRRPLAPEPGRLFEGAGDLKDAEVVAVAADDLDTNRQPVCG